MAITIPTLELSIGVQNREKAEAVRDRLIKNRFEFIAIEHHEDTGFSWVTFEKLAFDSYDTQCIEEVMDGEYYCFQVYVKF